MRLTTALTLVFGSLPATLAFTTLTSSTFAARYSTQLDVSTVSDPRSRREADNDQNKPQTFQQQIAIRGLASAAAAMAAAVNAAVAMKKLEAPDVSKSYIAMNATDLAVDASGLPLVYDKDLIEAYWAKERGALNQRWAAFMGKAVPFLTKLSSLLVRDGKILDKEVPGLAKQARLDLQDLGPTFIKAGQMMSVRPDVLPQAALNELAKLQDGVVPFDTNVAVQVIESELGGPLGKFFTSISEEPVAAASLAQVYLATLNDGKNTRVAVKVQRPDVLGTVSKDLYVLRRAAEVWQGLIDKFAPQQRTNYVALLNEWAIGFYTELDFENEAANQRKLRRLLHEHGITKVMVPQVFGELCTRRILVSDWVDGTKLSQCTAEQVSDVTADAQEAFLTQLFEIGFFHADPHPGNLLLLKNPTPGGARLALIDCGLMASIDDADRDHMISSLIHLANKDYPALVEDFINLQVLPQDTNRGAVIPLMDKALSPYVVGGGARKYEEAVKRSYGLQDGATMKSQVGGFQAMTQDALTVLNDIPFAIPPYFALLGRAIVTLEGVALSGDPDYAIILSSYPFVARKLMKGGRPEIQKALHEVLYSGDGSSVGLKLTRLLALLNNAAGSVAKKEGAVFVDLDDIPKDGISLKEGLKFMLSDNSGSLRGLLEKEIDTIVDVLSRQLFRRAFSEAIVAITPPKPPAVPFLGEIFPQPPKFDELKLPLILPAKYGADRSSRPSVALMTLKDFMDTVAPKLTPDEDVYAIGLSDAATSFFGEGIGKLVKGERVLSTHSVRILVKTMRSGALGRRDLISSDGVQSLLRFVENTLNLSDSSGELTDFEKDVAEAINSLDPNERQRFDAIVEDLAERATERAVERLVDVERLV